MKKPVLTSYSYALVIWSAVALLVAVLAFSKAKAPQERTVYSDIATHVMIASSIWHDFDLDYALQDLARFRTDFPSQPGPLGLFAKARPSGSIALAKPYLYGLAASVFYGALGVDGFILLNALCLFLVGATTALALTPSLGRRWALVASLGFVLPGPFIAWVSIPHPDLFIAAFLAVSGFLLLREGWSKGTLFAATVLLAAAVHEKPPLLVLVPFILLAAPPNQGIRKMAAIVAGGAVSLLVLSLPNLLGDGTLVSYQGARFCVTAPPFPLEEGWTLPASLGFSDHVFNPMLVFRHLLANLKLIPDKLFDFLFGRQTGILVYFPVALALVGMRLLHPAGRGLWLLGGFFSYLGLNWLAFPINGYGGGGTYGPRYMMQVLALVPLALAGCRGRLHAPLGLAAKIALLGMFILALSLHWRVPFAGEGTVSLHARWFLERPLSFFPVERWLLPSTGVDYPPAIREGKGADDLLFHLEQLANDTGFGSFWKDAQLSSILFHSGTSLPAHELEMVSLTDAKVFVKHKDRIVWQGSLLGGQPIRLSLAGLPADAEAFDLLSKKPWTWTLIKLFAIENETGLPAAPGRQVIRFARNYRRFEDFGHLIPTADLAGAGVLLDAGWSQVEPWGVWSAGRTACLLLYLGENANAYDITLRLHGYNPPEDAIRKVSLTVNGRVLSSLDLGGVKGPDDYRFRFRMRPGEEFVQLGFEIANPVSPADLGHGADSRRLGVGLTGLSISRIEEMLP